MAIIALVIALITLTLIITSNSKALVKDPLLSAYNNVREVKNAVSDFEKIKTAEVVLPVVFANVLHYEPGELGDSEIGRRGADVYYSEEALQDPEFLESIRRSPFTVGTHDKNTNEYNREVDGWPTEAWFDDTEKGDFVKGYVTGSDNVNYIRENKDNPRFGTSAYIDFIGLVEKDGVAPNGKPYNAIATKLHCNHLAILPNIRDEHNVIVAMNSVTVEVEKKIEAKPKSRLVLEKLTKTTKGKNSMEDLDKDVIKEVISEMTEEKEKASAIDAINERLDRMEEVVNTMAKNSEDEEAKNKAKNEEEETDKKEEDEEEIIASNAIPSQELILSVSNSLGVTFKETPSVKELASLVGVKEKTFSETLTALNSKCKEMGEVSAKNSSKDESGSFDSFLDKI